MGKNSKKDDDKDEQDNSKTDKNTDKNADRTEKDESQEKPKGDQNKKSTEEPKQETKNEKENFTKNGESNGDIKKFETTLQELIKDLAELNKARGKLNKLVEHLMSKISSRQKKSMSNSSVKFKLEKKEASKENLPPTTRKDIEKSEKNAEISFYTNLLNKLDRPKNKKVRFFEYAEQLPKRDWILIKSPDSNLHTNYRSLQKTK